MGFSDIMGGSRIGGGAGERTDWRIRGDGIKRALGLLTFGEEEGRVQTWQILRILA